MWPLRQSTASQVIQLGPFVDSTDGDTAETGLTIANTDIKLRPLGATSATSKNSGGATHSANGNYYATLDATDTATVGPMKISVKVAGALPVWLECMVYEEAVYDALFASGAPGYLQPTTAGRTLNVTTTGAAGIDWGNVENQSTSVNLSGTTINLVNTATTLTNGVTVTTNNDKTSYSLSASQTFNMTGNITGNLSGSVGSVTGAVGSVTGNVVGSVGSISGVTFPSNFGTLLINASGHISRVTLADTITTYTGNIPQSGDSYPGTVKCQAAVYDSATGSGGDTLTLSNGKTQTFAANGTRTTSA